MARSAPPDCRFSIGYEPHDATVELFAADATWALHARVSMWSMATATNDLPKIAERIAEEFFLHLRWRMDRIETEACEVVRSAGQAREQTEERQ